MKTVFWGSKYRVQLQVFDIVHYERPEWREVHFSVCILPIHAHSNRAFTTGTQVYFGPYFKQALTEIQKYASVPDMPKKLKPYLEMANRGDIFDGSNEEEWKAYGRELSREYLENERKKVRQYMGYGD